MNELKEQIKSLLSRAMNAADKEEKEVENEKVDKRKLIDEVAGIMKSAGCDDEVIRTAIGKMEKIGYDKSEADTADNCGKKAKNADEEEKEDEKAENKCKNSMDDVKKAVFGGKSEKQTQYIPHSKRLEMGNNY